MKAVGTTRSSRDSSRAALWTGFVLGVGLIGTLDGTVVHELLQWHRFYVDTTEFWRVFIDGLFHLGSALLLFVGAITLWRQRRTLADLKDGGAALGAGVLLGMGAFNLYDGVVQHKILKFHPVRLGIENQLPYDLAWNAVAVLLLLLGWGLWRVAKRRAESARGV
ncbi:DUF2243 domain-containing protein [soil metagenome]